MKNNSRKRNHQEAQKKNQPRRESVITLVARAKSRRWRRWTLCFKQMDRQKNCSK